ncbi:MAG: 50S ribosomal protein L19 [Planctomycetes bacterium]|nr:50S ribosomal protein L19 [Planctomycetota bacterium]
MRNPLFDVVEKKYKRAAALDFEIGDTVTVTLRIVEGEKERLQDFEGEVIARRGAGLDEMFTVRRLVGEEGVERTFPIHSPKISAIKVKRSGKVRRAKLYYLRDRVGKARKLRERRISAEAREAAAKAKAEKARKTAEAADVAARAGAELATV